MQQTAKKERLILPGLLFIGIALIGFGTYPLISYRSPSSEPAQQISRFVFSDTSNRPYLLTTDGQILIPDTGGIWRPANMNDDVSVNDIYIDDEQVLWAATDSGLRAHDNDQWRTVDSTPVAAVIPFDVHLIKLSKQGKALGTIENPDSEVPMPDVEIEQVLPLGGSQTAVYGGETIYVSVDAQNWTPLDSPGDTQAIWNDGEGHLLAGTSDGVMRWTEQGDHWEQVTSAPDAPFDDVSVFNEIIFATVNGRLLRFVNDEWEPVNLSQTGYLSQLDVQQGHALWALDAVGGQLWTTTDGNNWQNIDVVTTEDEPR